MNPPQTGELWQNQSGNCVLYVLGLAGEYDDVFTKQCLVIEHNDYASGATDV